MFNTALSPFKVLFVVLKAGDCLGNLSSFFICFISLKRRGLLLKQRQARTSGLTKHSSFLRINLKKYMVCFLEPQKTSNKKNMKKSLIILAGAAAE